MPSSVEISPPVLEKKIFLKGFYHIRAWLPSCDLDFLYTHWFPLPIDASYKILVGQAVLEEKIFEIVDGRTDGRTTDDGRTDGRRTVGRRNMAIL